MNITILLQYLMGNEHAIHVVVDARTALAQGIFYTGALASRVISKTGAISQRVDHGR